MHALDPALLACLALLGRAAASWPRERVVEEALKVGKRFGVVATVQGSSVGREGCQPRIRAWLYPRGNVKQGLAEGVGTST